MNEERYEYVTYDTSAFYIPSGMYSLQQIRNLLEAAEEMQSRLYAHLKESIQQAKDIRGEK